MGQETGRIIRLSQEWTLGDRIGGGGFGAVYHARSGRSHAAVKLIPKDPGAERELLFAEWGSTPNVVPVHDSGETEDHWVILMPLAEMSLREWLREQGGAVAANETIPVLADIATALAGLEANVVHRDLKPENVLLLDGKWCLADFGISRYAEATTGTDTRKYAQTDQYAAPERWRHERATTAVDVYSLGVIAFEMLQGQRPFLGPDYRHQHLHEDPPHLQDVPVALGALVDECLLKAPQGRPTAANILFRLERAATSFATPGLNKLQEANKAEVGRRAQSARQESVALTEAERRSELFKAAERSYGPISAILREAIEAAAPAASFELKGRGDAGWKVRLGSATLAVLYPERTAPKGWGSWSPPLEVIAHSALTLSIPPDRHGYEGRSHSLWYCDAQEAGSFAWFETAFMISPFMNRRAPETPFALKPGEEAGKAVGSGMNEYQVAWPFTPLTVGDMDDFVDRWGGWLADASEGRLHFPSHIPERPTKDSWRRG